MALSKTYRGYDDAGAGIDINIVDRCQNHVSAGPKVRRHYLKYEYKDEKQQAWAKLGKRLEEILTPLNKTL